MIKKLGVLEVSGWRTKLNELVDAINRIEQRLNVDEVCGSRPPTEPFIVVDEGVTCITTPDGRQFTLVQKSLSRQELYDAFVAARMETATARPSSWWPLVDALAAELRKRGINVHE